MGKSYEQLRQEFPVFEYRGYDFSIAGHDIRMQFHFATGVHEFHPKMTLSLGKYAIPTLREEDINGFVFQIGLIELISYWKAACCPTVHICRYRLTEQQQQWWKKLYWKGLGEFFYQNSISSDIENFMHFSFDENALLSPKNDLSSDKNIPGQRKSAAK